MKKYIFLLVTFLLFSGCVTSYFVKTGTVQPPYKGIVKVFYSIPDCEYQEIGIVSAKSQSYYVQTTHLIESMQIKAAQMGANAIILKKDNKTEESFIFATQSTGLWGGSTSSKELVGIAIRIK